MVRLDKYSDVIKLIDPLGWLPKENLEVSVKFNFID